VDRYLCALTVQVQFFVRRIRSGVSAADPLFAVRSLAQYRRCGNSFHNPWMIRGVN
jgi:hypothetical protein